jgi:omega-hydroxy-beta-dihydromenaquinone-9 sulfotransferase
MRRTPELRVPVTGIGLADGLRLLARQRFRASLSPRLAAVALIGTICSALGLIETMLFSRRVRAQSLEPAPLFVLGHWRSGTTHLVNLLGHDPAHTFSSNWQVIFASHFLLTGRIGPRLLASVMSRQRSYDAVEYGWLVPGEDEIALLKLTGGRSPYSGMMFPEDCRQYEQFLDFGDPATDGDRTAFLDALEGFVRKLMFAGGGRRAVLKSCPHTARIRLIRSRFPDARFVYIHRHPARIFASMLHMRGMVEGGYSLQKSSSVPDRWDQTARVGERLWKRYFEDRQQVPRDRLIEIAYDDLCGNELVRCRAIYDQLALPGWDAFAARLEPYIDRLRGYARNDLPLDAELLDYVYDRWQCVYREHGYARSPEGHR